MELIDRFKCTGCMACVQACPIKCIQIEEDKLGHKFPKIDHIRCIDCGKCMKTCPEENKILQKNSKKAYAVWSLNDLDRKTSASGGAASIFYQVAVKNNFYICGVEYDDNFEVFHSITNNIDMIEKYKQSKYVYSNSNHIYIDVKKKLDLGNNVLFISLPCKVAGLLNYLGKEYKNLITVDIVCHGTPSFKMLEDHISLIRNSKNATKLKFREDNLFMFKLYNESNTIYTKNNVLDEYLAAFLNGINYRESCYQCTYAKKSRVSDITICDFWGLGKKKPFNHPYTGSISAVLINTDNGDKFFDGCKPFLFFEEREVEEAVEGNSQLNEPTKKPEDFYRFKELYEKYNFDQVVKMMFGKKIFKYKINSFVSNVKLSLRRLAKYVLKRSK